MTYLCDYCGELFSTYWSCKGHIKKIHKLTEDKSVSIIHKKHHTQEYFQCDQCNKTFTVRKSLLRHVSEQHEPHRFSCPHCNFHTNRKYRLNEHKKTHGVKDLIPKPKESITLQNVGEQTVSQPASPEILNFKIIVEVDQNQIQDVIISREQHKVSS